MSNRMDRKVMEMLVKANNRLAGAIERLDATLELVLAGLSKSSRPERKDLGDVTNLALWALRCAILAWRDGTQDDQGHALWAEVAHHQLHLRVALGIDNEETDRFARLTEQVIADVRVFAEQDFEPVTRRLHAEHAADLIDGCL